MDVNELPAVQFLRSCGFGLKLKSHICMYEKEQGMLV